MKYRYAILSLICLLLGSRIVTGQDPNFHIYLCFGQSNMEGTAAIEEQDKIPHERFWVMQSVDCSKQGYAKNEWRSAVPPLTSCYTGLSPADYFGRTMVRYLPDSIKVGVIVVAVGGSDIRLFDKDIYENYLNTHQKSWFIKKIEDYGHNPYQHLTNLARTAQKDGVIKGILLHQGETNTGDQQWPNYVNKVYTDLLLDLNLSATEVPILSGKVVDEDQFGKCARMNPIIEMLPQTIPTAHVVESRGCAAKADSVHFNTIGMRELGKRYAEKMIEVKGINSVQ